MTRNRPVPSHKPQAVTYARAVGKKDHVPQCKKSWPKLRVNSARSAAIAPPKSSAQDTFKKRIELFGNKLTWVAECTGLERPILVRTNLPGIGRVYYAMEEPHTTQEAIALFDACWDHIQCNWGRERWDVVPFQRLLSGEASAPWMPLSQADIHQLESEYPNRFEMSSTYILDVPVLGPDTRSVPARPTDGVRIHHMTKLRALRPSLFFGYRKWQMAQ